MEKILINSSVIQLNQLLKWMGISDTGGQSKTIIDECLISVNNVSITNYRKKIYPGDLISIDKNLYLIVVDELKYES